MEENKEKKKEDKKTLTEKQIKAEKDKKKAEIKRLKDKYFEFYDDIKISDRQDW